MKRTDRGASVSRNGSVKVSGKDTSFRFMKAALSMSAGALAALIICIVPAEAAVPVNPAAGGMLYESLEAVPVTPDGSYITETTDPSGTADPNAFSYGVVTQEVYDTADPYADGTAADPAQQAETQQTAVGPYVNDCFGFTRSDLVRYMVEHASEYLGTPCGEDPYAAPVPGRSGNLQSENFVWHVLSSVATVNQDNVPCDSTTNTAPLGNGGGWVDWIYFQGITPLTFSTKEEMLASGLLEKGDIIWSFDYEGPYGLSNLNHVGFFWGDSPSDDVFWQSGTAAGGTLYAGKEGCNRITTIESAAEYPSVWWVFKLSPDPYYNTYEWTGRPQNEVGIIQDSGADTEEVLPDASAEDPSLKESEGDGTEELYSESYGYETGEEEFFEDGTEVYEYYDEVYTETPQGAMGAAGLEAEEVYGEDQRSVSVPSDGVNADTTIVFYEG
ncbi:MAG: hypothetical protein HUJ73_04305 [Eubacterium sp.]|nr:hypothetical protein [Eubacterium sp.]